MIEAQNGILFLARETVTKTKGGIHLPQMSDPARQAEACATGVIVALDKKDDDCKPFNVGDTVLYPVRSATEVEVDDEKLVTLGGRFIMAVTKRAEQVGKATEFGEIPIGSGELPPLLEATKLYKPCSEADCNGKAYRILNTHETEFLCDTCGITQ